MSHKDQAYDFLKRYFALWKSQAVEADAGAVWRKFSHG